MRVERSGAERVFQRIGQEYASNIHAVDVVNSSDAAHFIVWKRDGLLAPYVPEDVAKFYPAEHKDPDGQFASFRVWLSVIAYNTNLVKAEDAPKSFADLLDPKWVGKIVKAHPGYSGTIMTATYQMARDLGWDVFREARQAARHAGAVVGRSAQEARARRARRDGGRQRVQHLPAQGDRPAGRAGLCDRRLAADRRAERDLQGGAEPERRAAVPELLFSPEAQQLIIDVGGLRSMHPQTKEKPGRKPFAEIKTMKDDAAAVEKQERGDQGALHQAVPGVTVRGRW